MNIKRVFIGLLACLLLAGTVIGCSKTTETPEPVSEATTEPTAEPTAAPVDPIAEIGEAMITESKHAREDGYKNPFKTHVIDTELVAVHLENGDNYSDETLRALAKTVAADLGAIGAYTGEAPRKSTVYLIWNLLQDRPVLLGDHMICSVQQVETGAYREALIGMALDLPIVWKQIGLSELIFGAPDDSGLAAYYRDEAHMRVASCAAVYCQDGFADAETVAAARNTAASITAYLLETGGIDALRKAVSTADALPAWAERHGIETAFTLPDGHEQAAYLTVYNDRKPGHLCVLEGCGYVFTVNEGCFAETPDEAYDFVCRFLYGAGIVLDQIREESPTLATIAEQHAGEPIRVNLIPDQTQSGMSYGSLNEISLAYSGAAWHELIHALLMKRDGALWINEAIAEHFSRRARSLAMPVEECTDFDDRYASDTAEMTENELAFWKVCWGIYLAERAEDAAVPPTLYSRSVDCRAIGIAELLSSDDPTDWGQDFSVGAAAGRKTGDVTEDGNALSYFEATVLLEYLFGICGTETIAAGFMNGKPIEEICSKSYPELYRDCVAYYTEKYGDLLNAD